MLAASVENKRTEKHHVFLSDKLLNADYASIQLDSEGAWRTAVRLSTFEPEPPTSTGSLFAWRFRRQPDPLARHWRPPLWAFAPLPA